MNCSCRTSLRIFVQSLAQVQLSGHVASRPSRHFDPKAYKTNETVRSFTAASAVRYPQQPLRSFSTGEQPRTLEEHSTDASANNVGQSVPRPASSALDASDKDLEKARGDEAIFEFSSEAIDSLAANMERISTEYGSLPDHQPEAEAEIIPDTPKKAKQDLTGPSRLKRIKIMPSNLTVSDEQAQQLLQKKEPWQIHKEAMKSKFPDGWRPRKRLSPDALDGIRALHTQYPEEFTTDVLASKFEVSPEAIRRILKSKWVASPEEEMDRQERWFNRGKNIWSQMAALGTKPPKKWRIEGIVRDPSWNRKKGPRTEYPYLPRWREEEDSYNTKVLDFKAKPEAEPKEPKTVSLHRKVGGNLL